MSPDGGFVYRFPDRDFQLGYARRVPEVGDTLTAKGRRWRVVDVTLGHDDRVVVRLLPLDVPGENAEEPSSPE